MDRLLKDNFKISFLNLLYEFTEEELKIAHAKFQGDKIKKLRINGIDTGIELNCSDFNNLTDINQDIGAILKTNKDEKFDFNDVTDAVKSFINDESIKVFQRLLTETLKESIEINLSDFDLNTNVNKEIANFKENVKIAREKNIKEDETNTDNNIEEQKELALLTTKIIMKRITDSINEIIDNKLSVEKVDEIIKIAVEERKEYTFFIALLLWIKSNNISIKSITKDIISKLIEFSILANNAIINKYSDYEKTLVEIIEESVTQLNEFKEDLNNKLTKLKEEVVQCKKEKEQAEEDSKKYKKQVIELNKEKAKLSKLAEESSTNLTNLINKMSFVTNKEFKEDILKLTSQVKYNTIEKTLSSEIAKLNEQLLNEKTLNRKYRENIKEYNLEIESLKKIIEEKNIEIENLNKCNSINEEIVTEVYPTEIIEEKPKCKYGYIWFSKDNELYVHVPDTNEEIRDLIYDDDQYFIEGQVVKVSENKLVRTYDFYTDKYINRLTIANIKNKDGINKIYDSNNEEIKNVNKKGFHLYSSHFLGIDNYNNIKFMFKKNLMDNLFLYKKSILARGHNAYVCRDIVGSIYILNNIFTNEEIALNKSNINLNDFKVDKNIILILDKNNTVVSVNDDITFYTRSKEYSRKSYVTVFKTADKVYGKNKHGELILLNVDSSTAKDGEILAIDEYNNGLFITDSKSEPMYEVSKKIKNKTSISDVIDTDENLIIIGNPKYQSNYKLAFLKENINSIFVDGGTSINKVKREVSLSDAKAIIFCKNYISHDLMWRIKENYLETDIKVIMAENDGANNVVNLYKEGRSMLNGSQFNS